MIRRQVYDPATGDYRPDLPCWKTSTNSPRPCTISTPPPITPDAWR